MTKQNISLVSIVIPTYNRADILIHAIQSCLNQVYKNIEIIVVDDGSIDNTAEVVADLIRRDSRIKYFKKENAGLSNALNYGFKHAKGDYLTWTSDDNYYTKEAIQKMLSFLKQKKCSFVYCDYYRFYKKYPKKVKHIKLPESDILTQRNCIGPCFLYSRKVLDNIGTYDSETKLAEDYDYWIRTSKKFSIYHLDKPLYFYLEHKKSLSLSKIYETKVVTLLVRFKNNILNIKTTTNLFLKLKASQNWKFGNLPSKFTFLFLEIFSQIYYFYLKFRFSKKIQLILRNYKLKKNDFTATRMALENI